MVSSEVVEMLIALSCFSFDFDFFFDWEGGFGPVPLGGKSPLNVSISRGFKDTDQGHSKRRCFSAAANSFNWEVGGRHGTRTTTRVKTVPQVGVSAP